MRKQVVSTLKRHKHAGLWFVRIAGKPKYLGGKGTTEEEAELMRAELVREHLVKMADPATNERERTVDQLLEFFRRKAVLPPEARNTASKLYYLGLFSRAFGQRALATLAPYELDLWLASHKEWNSTTRRNCLKHVASAFNWLTRNGQIGKNPLKGVAWPKENIRGEDYLITAEEYARLLPTVLPQYREIIELLWLTGARPSEILGALAEEYNPLTHELQKRQHKNKHKGKLRNILLNARAEEIIKARAETVGQGLLFRSQLGNPISSIVLSQYMKKRFKAVGIVHPVCNYSFRHSFVCRCLENSVALHTVAA